MARTHKQINVDIGSRVRARREALGLSREALAERVGVSAHFLGDLERGNIGPSLETFRGLCQALETTDGELMWGDRTEAKTTANKIADMLSAVPADLHPYLVAGLRNQIELITAVKKEN